MILQVKTPDVEVLSWCGYTWSAVVRILGCTAKFTELPHLSGRWIMDYIGNVLAKTDFNKFVTEIREK